MWHRALGVVLMSLLIVSSADPRSAAGEVLFTADQVHEDLQALANCLQAMHPALDRHMSSDRAHQLVEQLRQAPATGMTEVALFAEVTRSLAQFGCLHTTARPSVTSTQQALDSPTLPPLGVVFAEGRVFVTHDLSDRSAVGVGSELLAINDRDCGALIEYMIERESIDGVAGRLLTRRVEPLFLWHYRWSFGPSATFKLRVIKDGREETIRVSGVDYATRQQRRADRYPDYKPTAAEAVSLEMIQPGVARLNVASFYKDGGDGAWFKQRFLEVFAALQDVDVQDLIIDVRNNGGGWDESPADLYAQLVTQPFGAYRRLSHRVKDDLGGMDFELDAENFSEYAAAPMGALARMREPGGLASLMEHYIGTHPLHGALWQPATVPYTGRVWVLIDEHSGSSGSEFPAYVKYHRRGVLIGRETGGGYAGCSGGILPLIHLPNSGIRVQIPLVRYDLDFDLSVEDASRGVRPDVVVMPRIEDVLSGRDTAFEKTLELIAAAQKKETDSAGGNRARRNED